MLREAKRKTQSKSNKSSLVLSCKKEQVFLYSWYKNYIFCTKGEINSKIKQPKKLFAREARKWKHLQIGKFKRKRA